MNLSPRNKLIVAAALALLVVVVLVAVLVVPAFRQMQSLSDQIETATQASDAASALLEQRGQIKDRAALTDTQLLGLAVAVPENPDLPSLIIDLQDLAFDSGVTLRSVIPEDPVIEEGAPQIGIPITLNVVGPWGDTVDYLQQLRRLPRQLRLTNMLSVPEPEPDPEAPDDGIQIKVPPYYQVATEIRVIAYVIPAGSTTATTAPAPAPAP